MSGITGIFYLDGRPVGEDIDQMVEVMSHRGPDGKGVWRTKSVGLGHLMLYTTPESQSETLPMVDRSGHFVITADARIDNREELIRVLDISTCREEPVTDSEIILEAYKKWGHDSPKKLLGAFAFAIWDVQDRSLFCVRDHFGVRPFYYYHQKGRLFAFASEIKALFQLGDTPRVPDEVKVAEHLMAPVEEDVTRTYFKHIRRLAPAHALVVKPDSVTAHKYWALDPNREIRLSSDEEYAEQFRNLFEDAVRARLRSTYPIGSMLSGGLDSSSITCQAARILRNSDKNLPLHTFSAVFDETSGSDERPYIHAVLDKYDELQPHFLQGDEKSPLAEWDKLYQYVDGACAAGNIYIFWRTYRLAREQGVRVVLDGFDGDTTVSHGLGYFNQLREEGRWLTLVREVGEFAKKIDESPQGAVWSWVKGPLLSLPGLSQLVRVRRILKEFVSGQSNSTRKTSEEPVWKQVLSDRLIQSVEPYLEQKKNTKPSTERENHYQLLTRPVMTHILDLWNYVGASSAIEVRYPFYDKRLVEFCLALPPDQKLRKGWSRLILRRGMEGILPHSVQWRGGKGNLSFALDQSLATYERALLKELMKGNIGGIERYVKSDFLRESVPDYLEGNIGSGAMGEGLIVWRSLCLALWLRHLEE